MLVVPDHNRLVHPNSKGKIFAVQKYKFCRNKRKKLHLLFCGFFEGGSTPQNASEDLRITFMSGFLLSAYGF